MSFAALPESHRVLESGRHEGLHVGAQLYVSLAGTPIADAAMGLARAGMAMTPDSMMTWLSCSKIATSIALARVWESGAFGLDDPVARHIPEFGARGKQDLRVRDLWTHTAGLLGVEPRLFAVRYQNRFDENLALICAAELDADAAPGRRAGYQTTAVMLVLAELLHRKPGRAFPEYCREELFQPLGMQSSWLGMSESALASCRDRLGETFDTSGAEPRPGSLAPDRPHQLTAVMPGGNGRGPMRELARLLELLDGGGEREGVRLLASDTVAALTSRQRHGLYDHTWNAVIDCGLGLTLDSKRHHGGANHLYGYGRYASDRSFGHAGFRTTLAFCDPECSLVVCCSWNGMVADDDVHSRRQHALCEALYRDLGLG